MPTTKKVEIEDVIQRLLKKQSEISIRSVGEAAGIVVDEAGRRAIRRALQSLADRKMIVAKGSGRSRVYVRPEQVELGQESAEPIDSQASKAKESDPFKGIELRPESQELLKYISQEIAERAPAGYDQEFLRDYVPNETFYLTSDQREKLLELGRVEAQERPAGTYARNILDRLLIDLSWNSSRLEGNTYSLLETKRLIELGEAATGKDAVEAQMILNHKAAIEYIVESTEDEQITSHEICSVHALLSENLLGNPIASGRLRTIAVGISGTTYIPLENPQVIQECFDIFVNKINKIADPFEQSLFSIVHLSYLQAFEDVNKRTARLIANVPLINENLKPLSFVGVDQAAYVSALMGIYERNDISLIRDLYLWAYRRSAQQYTAVQQSMGEPNLLKLRYRDFIRDVVRSIILERVAGSDVVPKIRELTETSNIPDADRSALFTLIETEIASLHEGNVARFKVRPSEYEAWNNLQ